MGQEKDMSIGTKVEHVRCVETINSHSFLNEKNRVWKGSWSKCLSRSEKLSSVLRNVVWDILSRNTPLRDK